MGSHMYKKLISYEHLLTAYKKAKRSKQNCGYVCEFDFYLEEQIEKLHKELRNKTYLPSPYSYFIITEPKTRHVAAPAFRDRVVQHALVSLIEPLFEPCFIEDSYACRKEKGTHYGMRRLKRSLQAIRSKYGKNQRIFVLQSDIKSYFSSIHWDVLLGLIYKKVECPDTREVIKNIICTNVVGDNRFGATRLPEEVVSQQHRRGLPIGNLTSQLFANIYLNQLDHFVKEELGMRWYGRYMDDFYILHPDPEVLKVTQQRIKEFLEQKLYLTLHPHKTIIQGVELGVPFVGYRVFHDHVLVRGKTLLRFERGYRKKLEKYRKGEMSVEEILAVQQSIRGHLSHCNSRGLKIFHG